MTCASVNRSRLPDDLRRNTIRHSVSKSRAFSKLDLSRRPPLAKARTLPNSRVHKVAMRLLSLQSVVRSTRAVAFSADMARPHLLAPLGEAGGLTTGEKLPSFSPGAYPPRPPSGPYTTITRQPNQPQEVPV